MLVTKRGLRQQSYHYELNSSAPAYKASIARAKCFVRISAVRLAAPIPSLPLRHTIPAASVSVELKSVNTALS